MAYELKSKNGQPIKKDGAPVLASDHVETKIEQLDSANMTFVAVASTEDEDRDKDIIRAAGWDLKNFKKSPVIPWSHNYWSPPIAKSVKTWVDNSTKRLLFKPKFDPSDEFSKMIFNKYANGFLTSFSVGFRPVEYTKREPDNWMSGKEFTKQELLEVSAVAVPANPNANVNLSFGEGMVKSMLDLGYPEFFAKREDEHLFYPIQDMGQFTTPRQAESLENEKGIHRIFAQAIDQEKLGKGEYLVGFAFEPSEFDKDAAIEFVKSTVDEPVKSFYYQVIQDEEKGITTIEPKEDEHTVYIYEDARLFNWGDPNSVKSYTYRVFDKNAVIDTAEGTQEPPPAEVPPATVPSEPVKIVEDPVVMTIEDLNAKIDGFTTTIETLVANNNQLMEANKVLNEKLVALEEKLGNNIIQDEAAIELEDTPPQDGEFELEDDNPGKEESEPEVKTENEELIEIDEAEMRAVGKGVLEGFKATIKKQLEIAVKNSGRID